MSNHQVGVSHPQDVERVAQSQIQSGQYHIHQQEEYPQQASAGSHSQSLPYPAPHAPQYASSQTSQYTNLKRQTHSPQSHQQYASSEHESVHSRIPQPHTHHTSKESVPVHTQGHTDFNDLSVHENRHSAQSWHGGHSVSPDPKVNLGKSYDPMPAPQRYTSNPHHATEPSMSQSSNTDRPPWHVDHLQTPTVSDPHRFATSDECAVIDEEDDEHNYGFIDATLGNVHETNTRTNKYTSSLQQNITQRGECFDIAPTFSRHFFEDRRSLRAGSLDIVDTTIDYCRHQGTVGNCSEDDQCLDEELGRTDVACLLNVCIHLNMLNADVDLTTYNL